jgi:cytochrome c biogenesis protein CcmG/thiol:disulfide interchange protein DsbE
MGLSRTSLRNIALAVGAIALVVAVVIGIDQSKESGGAGAGNPESAAVDYDKALADAPPTLARLYAKGDALIPGGIEALHAQLEGVRGYPAVVNVWASWCGPCRFEFPFFQEAVAKYGDRVAFIGLDAEDTDAAARSFLDELPLPYPSVTDPDADSKNEYDLRGFPATAFYDSKGEQVYLRPGPYSSADELAADIDKYAQ